jgi:serine/threonine protein kinase
MNHENIVKVYDIEENDDYIILVLELMEGSSLKEVILSRYKSNQPFSEFEISLIIKNILNALSYIHINNIIHRDIKPENVMFKYKNDLSSLKIIDFGLATLYSNRLNSFCGTMKFLSPEVISRLDYDYTVDTWACGVILYILCSGGTYPTSNSSRLSIEEENKYKSNENFSYLTMNLYKNLCNKNVNLRYNSFDALKHPFICLSSELMMKTKVNEENLEKSIIIKNNILNRNSKINKDDTAYSINNSESRNELEERSKTYKIPLTLNQRLYFNNIKQTFINKILVLSILNSIKEKKKSRTSLKCKSFKGLSESQKLKLHPSSKVKLPKISNKSIKVEKQTENINCNISKFNCINSNNRLYSNDVNYDNNTNIGIISHIKNRNSHQKLKLKDMNHSQNRNNFNLFDEKSGKIDCSSLIEKKNKLRRFITGNSNSNFTSNNEFYNDNCDTIESISSKKVVEKKSSKLQKIINKISLY